MQTAAPVPAETFLDGIVERSEDRLVVLSPVNHPIRRRILFVNSYGGAEGWRKIKHRLLPPHHLWGCLELVRLGYEVALAEPLPDFYLHRNPLPHDLRLLRIARSWLGRDGIVYCGHNVLYWLPLLSRLGALRARMVSLLFAREPLDLARAHHGIIALTPAAAAHARQLAPRTRMAHLGWGVDLSVYPLLDYTPRCVMSCGIANRDFVTLSRAAALSRQPMKVIVPGAVPGVTWPAHVAVVDGGRGWNCDDKRVTFEELLRDHYATTLASMVVLKRDDAEYTANGFTNLLEAMALRRAAIVTRTGALPGEIDVEQAGCGLHVPPDDPTALARAIDELTSDPERAREMGARGRALCERHYNIGRYARQLHEFFESL